MLRRLDYWKHAPEDSNEYLGQILDLLDQIEVFAKNLSGYDTIIRDYLVFDDIYITKACVMGIGKYLTLKVDTSRPEGIAEKLEELIQRNGFMEGEDPGRPHRRELIEKIAVRFKKDDPNS